MNAAIETDQAAAMMAIFEEVAARRRKAATWRSLLDQ
jgi:hypothetical protein